MRRIKLFFKLSIICLLTLIAFVNFVLAQQPEYKIQPTDVLKITVHEQPDLTNYTRVTSDGYITFPLIGKVHAKDKTVQDLEIEIKHLLEKDYLVSAQVMIFIEKYHPKQVSVIGEVNEPGKYNMPEEKDMTLLEAIAMAGGFAEDADINSTKVIRVNDKGEKVTIRVTVKDITNKGQKEKDINLNPDDIIFVPESFF